MNMLGDITGLQSSLLHEASRAPISLYRQVLYAAAGFCWVFFLLLWKFIVILVLLTFAWPLPMCRIYESALGEGWKAGSLTP